VRWKKRKFGADSEVFAHFVKAIGDPDKDQAAIRAVSPAYHIDAIKIPILLIHGDNDEIVPYSQSESLQKLLNKSGHKTELLKVKDGGHGGFEDDDTKVVLSTIGSFLWDNLGKGYGVSEPPVKYSFEK
jgi:dipeptidyl aminopeptidase/acylaminoacyl peptidase